MGWMTILPKIHTSIFFESQVHEGHRQFLSPSIKFNSKSEKCEKAHTLVW